MHKLCLSIVLAVIALCGAAASHADRPLDREAIQRWITANTDLEAWLEAHPEQSLKFDDALSYDGGNVNFDRVMDTYQNVLNGMPGALAIIRRHGYAGAAEWARTSARITFALMAIELQDIQPAIGASMAEAVREIEANPYFTDEQREEMLQQIRQAMDLGAKMAEGAREEDLPAVRAMRKELSAVFEFGGDDDDMD